MRFEDGGIIKIWEVKRHEDKYIDVRASTSAKDKRTGEYETSFSGFVRLIGTAKEQFEKQHKDSVTMKIGHCAVGNNYDKNSRKEYWNCMIFSFDDEFVPKDGGGSTTNKKDANAVANDGFEKVDDNMDGELPFA